MLSFFLFDRLDCPVGGSVFPYSKALSEVGSMLVVVLRLPEIRLQWGMDEFFAIDFPADKCSTAVDGDRTFVGVDDEALCRFLCCGWLSLG